MYVCMYVCKYVYLSRTSCHAVHDSHVGAHMFNIVHARTLIDSRLDYQGYLWMLQNLRTERRDYGVGVNEKGHAALTKQPNKGNED